VEPTLRKLIVTIGEVVWDMFPDREVLGGAPVNVAYHLQGLGEPVLPVTRVGTDPLGEQTRERLEELGLSLAGVQVDPELPTGRVLVTLEGGEPRFEIASPAAWDAIDGEEALNAIGEVPFDLVFGTLAQRHPVSRETIALLAGRSETCYYDVNLRPPFTVPDLVLPSLGRAQVVKMNEHELVEIAKWEGLSPDPKEVAKGLFSRYDLKLLVVTEGAKGAWLFDGTTIHRQPAEPVEVVDTVGAGDAFFAALIHGLRQGLPLDEVLAAANRRGAYVASRAGATPPLPPPGA